MLVNFSHSLSPEAQTVFEMANEDFVFRLDTNYNTKTREVYLQPEDFPKILNTLLDHKQMSGALKEGVINYINDNSSSFTYSLLSELAVIYATKMDEIYCNMFF